MTAGDDSDCEERIRRDLRVCLWVEDHGADEVVAMCGHIWFAGWEGRRGRAWPLSSWVNLPREAQCLACLAQVRRPGRWNTPPMDRLRAEIQSLGRASARSSDLLSLAIFFWALAGQLTDPALRRLIAKYVAGDTECGLIALDRAEELGLSAPCLA